jgi:predicted ATP-dependent protease
LTEIQDAVKDGLKIIPIEKIEDAVKYVFGEKQL